MHNTMFQSSKLTQMANLKAQNTQKGSNPCTKVQLQPSRSYHMQDLSTPWASNQVVLTYLRFFLLYLYLCTCHQLLIIRNPSDTVYKLSVI